MTTTSRNYAPRDSRQIVRELVAHEVSITIADMDPHTLQDLIEYVGCLNEARQQCDQDRVRYIRLAIQELFEIDCNNGDQTIDEWEEELVADSTSEKSVASARIFDNEFINNYHSLKEKAGLKTQREVAIKCGLSINTVSAIESERVRPQWRTIERLAKGFGVKITELMGTN